MKDFTIRDHLHGSATFSYYRDGIFWYRVSDTDLLFPIPAKEVKGTLLVTEKAAFFKQWIIKELS